MMRCEDLVGVQITGGVEGDMSPVGVIREWEFRCELFRCGSEEMEWWGPLEEGGLKLVVTRGCVKG